MAADVTPDEAAYWPAPLARAVVAAILAIVITFTADHSAALGLAVFAGFALLTGAAVLALHLRRSTPGRGALLAVGVIDLVAGIAALAGSGAGVPYLLVLLSGWAAITGFLELGLGIRRRGRSVLARDWLFTGILTCVLALVALLVPPGFVQDYTGPDGVARQLTASVVVVGSLGAYAALVAVYLVIAALTLRWPPAPRPAGNGTPE